jgi:hypothetical protein
MADWKKLPAGSKERYNAAKNDPSVTVGGFMGGDYTIRPKTAPARKTEDQMGKSAGRFFAKKMGATSSEANRFSNASEKAFMGSAKKAAIRKRMGGK